MYTGLLSCHTVIAKPPSFLTDVTLVPRSFFFSSFSEGSLASFGMLTFLIVPVPLMHLLTRRWSNSLVLVK